MATLKAQSGQDQIVVTQSIKHKSIKNPDSQLHCYPYR